jgi:hypothetical protein
MGLQVTASQTDLFLNCQRPFDPAVELDEREFHEGAAYGTRGHKAVAELLRGKEVSDPELKAHAIRSVKAIEANYPGYTKADIEVPLATEIDTYYEEIDIETRYADFTEEGHHYDLRPKEIGGTPDLVLTNLTKGKKRLV